MARRAVADAHEGLAHHPVARDAGLAAEELRKHQRHGEHQLGHAQRDHGKRRAGLLGRHVAEQDGEEQPGHAAHQRDQAHRDRPLPVGRRVERVHRHVRAQAGVDRVAEAQHAALAEQDVVGQAGDDGDAHLREHGDGQVAAEHQRRTQQHQREQRPDNPAADVVGFEFVIRFGHDWPSAGPFPRKASAPLGGSEYTK